jgi:cell division GTPase FtsZ
VIYQNVDPNANIIFGALVDDAMGDNMVVTGTYIRILVLQHYTILSESTTIVMYTL